MNVTKKKDRIMRITQAMLQEMFVDFCKQFGVRSTTYSGPRTKGSFYLRRSDARLGDRVAIQRWDKNGLPEDVGTLSDLVTVRELYIAMKFAIECKKKLKHKGS